MVGLITHAHDPATPPETAWLLAGSVGLMLVALAVAIQTLEIWAAAGSIHRPTVVALLAGSALALAARWLRPAPWILALLLVIIMTAIWIFTVNRWLASGLAQDRSLPN